MTTARMIYKANHADVRKRVRDLQRQGKPLHEARREVFRQLRFWMGDTWSLPASPAAQAALVAATDHAPSDVLATWERVRPKMTTAENLRHFLTLRTCAASAAREARGL